MPKSDVPQPLPLLRSLQRWRTLREHMCARSVHRSVSVAYLLFMLAEWLSIVVPAPSFFKKKKKITKSKRRTLHRFFDVAKNEIASDTHVPFQRCGLPRTYHSRCRRIHSQTWHRPPRCVSREPEDTRRFVTVPMAHARSHRADLKPENLLFRNKGDKESDIMIADFGLSRVMPEDKLHKLTEVCGTPGVSQRPIVHPWLTYILNFTVHGARNIQKE